MPLCAHSVGTYQETSSHATCQGSFDHSRLSSLSHCGLILAYFLTFYIFTFYNCIVPMGFLPWKIRVALSGKSQLQQSRATQTTVHAGCFKGFP